MVFPIPPLGRGNVVTYMAGIPGGLFSPSLSIGAGLAQWVHAAFAWAPMAAVIALCMMGYLAAVTQSPITLLRENASARFLDGFTITSNGGAGVSLNESSSALFGVGTVAGNAGGTDVFCGPQFASARGAIATNIGGGATNCTEPSP